jgi:hypothetical protein
MKHVAVVCAVLALLLAMPAASEAAARKVVVEIQTSTTCAPCYPADVFYFQSWLPNYGGASQIVTVSYHVWWPTPGNDPMFLANQVPVQTRVNYYSGGGSTYAPRAYIDGFVDGTSGYTTWPGAIETRFIDPSPVTITITGSRNGTTLNLNAAVYAEMPVTSSNWRVHWVVLESGISAPQNSGSGYVPFIHDHVMRNMYPDANGSAISISQGQTVNFPMTINLGASWVPNNCRVAVFIQNNTDKKIQQAEYVEVQTLTGVGDPGDDGLPTAFDISQNYPNPFNPNTTIDYAVKEQAQVSLKIYNLLGQEVRTLVSEQKLRGVYKAEWDGRDDAGRLVPSGMYLYKMNAGSFSETRKMMYLK